MTRKFSAKKQRNITAVEVTCKKVHGRNRDQFPTSDCFERNSTNDPGTDTDHSLFNSLTQPNRSASNPTRQRPRNPKKQRARRRPKTPWNEKALYQRARCVKRLKPCQVAALHDADYHARCIGLQLNQFVTIRWKWTALGDAIDNVPFIAGKKAMAEWFERRSLPLTLAYVHEAPEGQFNTHILIHVPKKDQEHFIAKLHDWFEATDNAAINVQPRHRRPGPDTRLTYMCKGTDIVTASRIGGRAKRQGIIPFKRCGTTANIGSAARARFKAPAGR